MQCGKENVMRKLIVLLLWAGLLAGGRAGAKELLVLEVPQDGKVADRLNWKPGADFKTGAAIDNGRVALLVTPGSEGLLLASSANPATAVEIKPVTEQGANVKIESVKLGQKEKSEAVLTAGLAGGGEISVKVQLDTLHVEVAGVKGVSAIDVCAKIKNTVLPDFFGFDALFAPERYKSDKLTIPAENFLLNFIEGGDGIAMCVWQGTLSLGAKEAKSGREPKVELFLSGEGAARRINKSRIEFAGKPVHVALLAGKGIWHEEDVGAWSAQNPVELKWAPPYEAQWRASFIAKEGKASADLVASCLSNDVMYRDGGARWVNEIPTVSIQGLWPYFIYSFWINKDKVCLALYADMNPRKEALNKNNAEAAAAKKENRPAVAVYPENIYEKALIYPINRRKDTPLSESTPVDVMRDCLGQGPCEYVLDLEGVKARPSGGSRNTEATCGNYDNNIRFFVDATSGRDTHYKVGDKKLTGVKPGEKLPQEFEDRLVTGLEDMTLFVTAVNKRLREYQAFNKKLTDFCKAEMARSEKIKPAAEKLLKLAAGLQGAVSDQRMQGFNKLRDDWAKKIQDMIADVRAGNYKTFAAVGGIRDGLAEPQDITVSVCRRFAKSIRIEASATDSSDPDVLKFTSAVRAMSQEALRNKHGMEGF
jgi:hypothetical protein